MQNINNFENAFGKADVDFQNSIYRTLSELSFDEDRHFMRKPKLRIIAIAAIVCVLIFGTAAALAVTGFIDFGSFYNSIFANPEAVRHVSTDNKITVYGNSDDLIIEPIAAFRATSEVYLQLKITTLNGELLPETLFFLSGDYVINLDNVMISRIDDYSAIVTFSTNVWRPYTLDSGKIYIDGINPDTVVTFDAVSSVPERIATYKEAYPPPTVNSTGDVSYENAITFYGSWEITLVSPVSLSNRLIFTDFNGIRMQIMISPVKMYIDLFNDENTPFLSSGYVDELPFDSLNEGLIIIMLNDGRVVEPQLEGGMIDDFMARFWYLMEFIDPDNVISVEINGIIFKEQDPDCSSGEKEGFISCVMPCSPVGGCYYWSSVN